MDYTETLRVISKITSLDPRWRADDKVQAVQQVGSWTEVLADVPWWFADAEVTRFYSTGAEWQIRPGQMREAWLRHCADQVRGEEEDERACPWARLCSCGHARGTCTRGWLDVEEGEPAKRCPECHEARNLKRAEANQPAVPLH